MRSQRNHDLRNRALRGIIKRKHYFCAVDQAEALTDVADADMIGGVDLLVIDIQFGQNLLRKALAVILNR